MDGDRSVERDDGSVREPPEKLPRHLTGPTSRVDDALATGEIQSPTTPVPRCVMGIGSRSYASASQSRDMAG
ncbi:MAG: hypothetical protein E6G58_04600 [Actinobacteria bacterium]|nr:MAG: hypothetical protein E6G58_04600 [Actinomycetota bacterium]